MVLESALAVQSRTVSASCLTTAATSELPPPPPNTPSSSSSSSSSWPVRVRADVPPVICIRYRSVAPEYVPKHILFRTLRSPPAAFPGSNFVYQVFVQNTSPHCTLSFEPIFIFKFLSDFVFIVLYSTARNAESLLLSLIIISEFAPSVLISTYPGLPNEQNTTRNTPSPQKWDPLLCDLNHSVKTISLSVPKPIRARGPQRIYCL